MVHFEPKVIPVGPRVLVLVGDWVEDYEAIVPIQTLECLGVEVDVVSPGKVAGQLVLSCVHDFDRADIDGASDILFQNAAGLAGGVPFQYQAVSERFGHAVLITREFDAVDPNDYAAVIAPGGRSPETLQLNDSILTWVHSIFESGRPVAGICHGIQILASAGILAGRTCTGHPCCRPQVELAGAHWEPTDKMDTVVDGNLITAAEWTATPGMMRTIAVQIGVLTTPDLPARTSR